MNASAEHQRRIRTLFTELEAREKTSHDRESDEDDEVNPVVQVIASRRLLKYRYVWQAKPSWVPKLLVRDADGILVCCEGLSHGCGHIRVE